MQLSKFSLHLEGIHFKRWYLIYIIELQAQGHRYFYIGQTGDNYHLTTRPAFRRLSGHFQDISSSTQNQLYRFIVKNLVSPKGLAKKLTEDIRMKAEDILETSRIIMHVYPLIDFNPGEIDIFQHRENNKLVKEFEKHVVRLFREHMTNDYIINKQDYEPQISMSKLFPDAWEQVKLDFFEETVESES